MTYLVVDADEWEIAGHEQAGLTPHDWLRHPETSELWLWKPVIARRTHRYEHWAEKVVSELALAFGVPCAAVQLARRLDTDGCLSRNVRPSGWSIHSGAEIIAAQLPSFDPRATPAAGYHLDAVELALAAVEAPTADEVLGLPPGCRALGVFAGYLMLDAMVANTDRHARNYDKNEVNRRALVVTTGAGGPLGWIPDALIGYVSEVLARPDARLVVVRRNGPEQPAHLRLVAGLTGSHPAERVPFSALHAEVLVSTRR